MAILSMKSEWCPTRLKFLWNFIVEKETDVEDLPHCHEGSTATVQDSGNAYVINRAGTWSIGERDDSVIGPANKVYVTDANGVPGWDDRKCWVELAAIAPEIFSDPDVEITYDAGKTEIAEKEFYQNADIEVAYFPNVEKIGLNGFAFSNVQYAIFPKCTDVTKRNAFGNCAKLKLAYFPQLSEVSGGGYTFSNCSALREVIAPNLRMISTATVFSNCGSLETLTLPALESLAASAIERCTALKRADFPVLTSIGRNAMRGCSALETVILRSPTLCTSDVTPFNQTPIASGTGYIYVPAALIEDYKVATNWSTYAAQFRAIEDYPEICDPDWDGTYGDVCIPADGALTLTDSAGARWTLVVGTDGTLSTAAVTG